ncbi:phosphatidic Acid Phospholipase A1 isoform 4-T4 [Glossina fuscipes fuscipes]
MSEPTKFQRPGDAPIKNPLLSASVTGITLDDFSNKPLLLPAAPPIVQSHPVPVRTPPPTLVGRESKTLVTVGTAASNDENLHEINLNNSNEENAIVEHTDLNGNSLLQSANTQAIASDSILIQAASSFSALPSVASNVFSTFSKRISGISSRDTTTTEDSSSFQQPGLGKVNTQSSSIPQPNQQLPSSSQLYNPPQGDLYSQSILTNEEELLHNLPLAKTPKLYTPTDIAVLPAPCAPPPSTGNGHNTFRLNAKRKLYAPIPDLSEQNIQSSQILDSLTTNSAPNDFPQPFPPSSCCNPKPEEDAESNLNQPINKSENTIDSANFFFDPNALNFINSNIIRKPEQSLDTDLSIENQKTCKESGQSKAKSTATCSLSAAVKEIFKSERDLISDDNKDKSILKSSPSQIITSFNFSTSCESTNSEVFKPTPQISSSLPLLTPLPSAEHKVIPSYAEKKANVAKHQGETTLDTKIPPPIGFESLITDPAEQSTFSSLTDVFTTEIKTSKADQQKEVLPVNTFLNYFNQPDQTKKEIDSTTFFDNFNQQKPTISIVPDRNEEQRLQNFFNNPPNETGDLNYNLIHSGLTNKDLIQRSTSTSIQVEPPSSSCSEFSEFINNTTAFLKSKIYSEQLLKESKEKFHKKEPTTTPVEDCTKIESVRAKNWEELPEEILKELRMANLLSSSKGVTTPNAHGSYKQVIKHWFFKRIVGGKQVWTPFSHYDSALLETSVLSKGDNIVAVEGGRYDVYIKERKKFSVYWDSEPIEVRRCSWFYKATDSKYVPYEEETSDLLEAEYKSATESGQWHNTIILSMGEQVVFHGPTVIVHFQQQQNTDAWGGSSQTTSRPRVVKRDLDDFNIEQGECHKVDHLLFMVHGIGSVCDLKLRTVEEVVEDFRAIARQLVQSHYKNSIEMGSVGRVEVLPVSWHSDLHSREVGIDEQLKSITLESIPKLRNFTNDTLLDVLFYTSPTYCQKIMNTVATSMNATYTKYRERNPDFNGGVSLAGHSLGSLILFDLLCHQNPLKENEEENLKNLDQPFMTMQSRGDMNQTVLRGGLALEPQQITYSMGPAGSRQPFIQYVQLIFQPKKFFALGSPIGMFVTIRGIDKLGLDFRLPTCTGFYNIFHPYDPVAYRIEALINPDLSGIRPVLISHHKGRKRMHLELKETMTRVSMDLKNRFFDRFRSTLESVDIFGLTSKSRKEAEELMEMEVEKVIEMQRHLEENEGDNQTANDNSKSNVPKTAPRIRTDSNSTGISDDMIEIDFPLGKLNDSKRVDYVLQEAPLEFFNEYIFALSSHVCYWDSEDTILFVMKEIYAGLGVTPDSQVPQQTMTIERPSSCNSLSQASISLSGS